MTQFTLYPADIRESAISRNPYMKLKSFQYRERNFVFDSGRVEPIDPKKTNEHNYYLPVPESIQNSHNLGWEMADLKAIKGLESIFAADSAVKGTQDALDDLGAIVGAGAARLKGITANPKKQALFNGVDPRSFSFSWNFAPQSLKEAQQLESLVRRLTQASLPNLVDDDTGQDDEFAAFFDFPDEFEIEFINVEGFPKIYNTVCTSVQTNYTPSQLQLLTSGHAVQISLSLTFLETELLRKTKPGV